jgi:hypothetical protein
MDNALDGRGYLLTISNWAHSPLMGFCRALIASAKRLKAALPGASQNSVLTRSVRALGIRKADRGVATCTVFHQWVGSVFVGELSSTHRWDGP